MRTFIFTAFLIVAMPVIVNGDEVLKAGMNAPVSVVGRFAAGRWAAEHGSACPVLLHREAPKIAIYARQPGDEVWQLAKAVDELVESEPSLKWSYLFVSHEHAPTPSAEEWDAQFAVFKQKATDLKLKQLSVGQLIRIPEDDSTVRAKRQLGIFGAGDVVLMVIGPAGTRGVIRYVDTIQAKDLDAAARDRAVMKLKQALNNDDQ